MDYLVVNTDLYSMVSFWGELDTVADGTIIAKKAYTLLAERGVDLVFDLTEVTYLNASMCGFFASICRAVLDQGNRFFFIASSVHNPPQNDR